jgi:hypothetical protein
MYLRGLGVTLSVLIPSWSLQAYVIFLETNVVIVQWLLYGPRALKLTRCFSPLIFTNGFHNFLGKKEIISLNLNHSLFVTEIVRVFMRWNKTL